MADASLPNMRARSSPGTAIAAMIPIIATTSNSSMRLKPSEPRIFMRLNRESGCFGDDRGSASLNITVVQADRKFPAQRLKKLGAESCVAQDPAFGRLNRLLNRLDRHARSDRVA